MSRIRINVVALLALAILATTLAGCGRRGLIRINGEKISKDDFYANLQKVPVQTQQGPEMAGRYMIKKMISDKLVEQLAKDQGVPPTEAQVNKKIDFFKKQSGGDVRTALAQRGMTLDDLKRQTTVQQSMINVVSKGISIPDDKVKKAYNEALNAKNSPFIRPEGTKISGIICKDKAKADKAYKLLSEGTDFGTVAMQYSESPSGKQSQGILGWVSKGMQGVPPEVSNTAFSLQVGKFSKPFHVTGTWVILKADQRRPKKITTYDEVKDMIREQLAIREGSKKKTFADAMIRFTKKADIVINDAQYKDIADTIKKEAAKSLDMLSKTGATGVPAATPAAAPK